MTIEEFYKEHNVLVSMPIDVVDTPSHTMAMMREYAKLKCQELLEIVVEKVNIRHTFTSTVDGKITHDYDKMFVVENSMFSINKDSMFSVVDLDSFIS